MNAEAVRRLPIVASTICRFLQAGNYSHEVVSQKIPEENNRRVTEKNWVKNVKWLV